MKKKNVKEKRDRNKSKKWFSFFNKFSLIGIIAILVSIIISLLSEEFWAKILENLLSTIGIALFIGAIFDFSKNSEAFTEFITNILKDIIISKSFLKELEESSKQEALEMILKPSDNQLEQCASINQYYKKKIKDSMEMFDTNFKTNLSIDATAVKKEGVVCIEGVMTNRVYKVKNNYEPIYTTFERDDCTVENIFIIDSEGNKIEDIQEKELVNEEVKDDRVFRKYRLDIPEKLNDYPYLTIQRTFCEKGYGHWTNFHWTSLTACDGITFTLKCDDGLFVKDYLIFDNKKLYAVKENNEKTEIRILSGNWLDKFTGFTLTISENKE